MWSIIWLPFLHLELDVWTTNLHRKLLGIRFRRKFRTYRSLEGGDMFVKSWHLEFLLAAQLDNALCSETPGLKYTAWARYRSLERPGRITIPTWGKTPKSNFQSPQTHLQWPGPLSCLVIKLWIKLQPMIFKAFAYPKYTCIVEGSKVSLPKWINHVSD